MRKPRCRMVNGEWFCMGSCTHGYSECRILGRGKSPNEALVDLRGQPIEWQRKMVMRDVERMNDYRPGQNPYPRMDDFSVYLAMAVVFGSLALFAGSLLWEWLC